jgi:three-Cys-motif partner protein
MPSGKIPTSDWLKNKLDRLVEMTEVVKKECPQQYSEAEPAYGFWSIKKEIALMYWIYPFQQIAKNYFKSFYYIDLFAGAGLMKAENFFFVGSPIVAVSSTLKDKGFSQYICIESDEARKVALEKRIQATCTHFGTCKPKVFQGNCNVEIDRILKQFCPTDNTCFLAFIDPQGISDLKWKTLQKLLTHGKGDIILNFPTMGINRNLTIPECASVLTEFIGDDDWKECDIEEVLDNFKGNLSQYRGVVDSIEVKDEHNHRLYDLVFATNSQGMKNALGDLKEKLNKIQTKDIRGLYAVVAEGQKQLDLWSKS